ncbi:TonB-dependent receptor domain-containing protein [Bordetella parapertussis]|uniref:TonB-dependent receptor domain-containing protein n=1 Tax=Bordetella parapertussis TaxID=519 RepID=UPI0007569082|nr:TonB-dependent receptor [Bordetella parapertussis]PNM46793.1 TonB-dependent receptor [Bordetella parapertussis]RFT77963.1 TonB-dependent receptor [Bordetella parapertussis]UEB04221.1 TonB-dependent receptor [Bordetella parapertussis]SUV74133.1 outer membrane protein [Bordetella parapertussis]
MKSRSLRRCAGVLACAAPLAGHAQAGAAAGQPIPELDPVVVTAARSPQLLRNVLADASVIERDTLARAGQSSLAEVLAQQHGIEFADSGGPQSVTSLFMRGANSNQTLVLLNGQRINNANGGGIALNALPPQAIERIEIVRGAASSLYGADAIGGVINIITREPGDKALSAYANAGYGTYGTSRYDAGVSGAADGFSYSLSTGYGQSHGFNATNRRSFSYNPDKDSYYQNYATGTLGYEWRPEQKVVAQVYRSRINGGYDASASYDYNDRYIQDLQAYSLASENRLTRYWKSTLRAGYVEDKNDSRAEGMFEDNNTRFRTRQMQYLWQNDFTLAAGQTLTLAYEHLDQRADGQMSTPTGIGNYTETRRHVNSYTGVYLGDFGRHHVQASLRNDDNSQFGSHTTGGLAYGFDLTPNLRATVAANTGFRAPSFNDLYTPTSAFGYRGNPDLKPEESRNAKIGLKYQDEDSELGVVYYQTRIKNLIQVTEDCSTVENVGRARLQGFTISGAHRFGNTRLRASLDLSNPRNEDTGKQLLRRARTVLRAGIDHRFDRLLVGAEWYASDERYDYGFPEEKRLGGYGLVNLTAAYDLSRNMQVQVRWNNVLGQRYTLADGYNTAGSNAFVNLSWRM